MINNIFIIGSKGIPANYGGFETFVDKLTENLQQDNIKIHVSCMSDNNKEFEHNKARCFNVKVPNIGPAKAVLYDIYALKKVVKYIKDNNINNSVVYILACRIGPFLNIYKNILKKHNIEIFVNPDGNEWKRSKWNKIIRMYWKYSEKLMVKNADLLICDSKGIEKYIKEEYHKYNPDTLFISYGAETSKSKLKDDSDKLLEWYKKHNIINNKYYLIVGRFVPENNYELMIKEFMKTNIEKDLIIISNVEQNKFYNKLIDETKFENDSRVKFVGTVYDQELLKKIRENAYAYIHGHEVGGTNPSLLEALATTKLNILLDVVFNREVGQEGAIYFTKSQNSLMDTIYRAEKLETSEIEKLSYNAKDRISKFYSWDYITEEYKKLFIK